MRALKSNVRKKDVLNGASLHVQNLKRVKKVKVLKQHDVVVTFSVISKFWLTPNLLPLLVPIEVWCFLFECRLILKT